MNPKEYKERLEEVKNYHPQVFNETIATERNYSLLGGSHEIFIAIKESIGEVLNDLYKETKLYFDNPNIIPQVFKNFNNKLVTFNLIRTSILIDILKRKGTLRAKLDKEIEEQLYNDFIVSFEDGSISYNPYTILLNCLLSVIEKGKEYEIELAQTNKNIKYKAGHLLKKEAFFAITPTYFNNPIVKQNKHILKQKINSNLTVGDHIVKNIEKYLSEPIDVFEFKHKIRNLGYTYAKERPESVIKNEVEIRISNKRFIEYMAGKSYSKLQTRSKDKIKDMLYKLKEDDILFFEMVDGQLTMPFGKLYRYDIRFLTNGTQAYTLYINISDLDLRNKENKNYVYLEDKDFDLDKQAETSFWNNIKNIVPPEIIDKIGKNRMKRIKTNKVFKAAHLKFQQFCRANYRTKHHFILLTEENFNKICGNIVFETKKIMYKEHKPLLETAIIKIIRRKILWIAKKKLKWASVACIKNNKVIVALNIKRFNKKVPFLITNTHQHAYKIT
jgi:hypothetical protein